MSRAAKRTTVSGQDVVRALDDIDMPEYSAAAQDFLVAFKKASGKAAAGHLYVRVAVRPHPRFSRDGPNLHLEERIGVDVATLGGAVRVPTLEGGTAEVRVPAGTQPGDVLRLRGRGIPALGGGGSGDLLVRLAVTVPRTLTPRQRELMEEFGKLSRGG